MEARQVRAFLRQYDPYLTGCRNSGDMRKGERVPVDAHLQEGAMSRFEAEHVRTPYDCDENGVAGLQIGLLLRWRGP
jgi:hypothetical protein